MRRRRRGRGALGRLFAPRSIALVGVPGDLSRPGARPLHFLRRHGYPGRLYPVNPRHRAIGDLPAYAEPRRAAGGPRRGLDRPAGSPGCRRDPRVRPGGRSVRRGSRRGLRGDRGAAGTAEQARLRESARRAGVRVLGPEHGRVRQRMGPRGAHLLDRRQAGRARAGAGGGALAIRRCRGLSRRPGGGPGPRRGPVRLDRQRGRPDAGGLPRLAGRGRPRPRGRVSRRAGAGSGPRWRPPSASAARRGVAVVALKLGSVPDGLARGALAYRRPGRRPRRVARVGARRRPDGGDRARASRRDGRAPHAGAGARGAADGDGDVVGRRGRAARGRAGAARLHVRPAGRGDGGARWGPCSRPTSRWRIRSTSRRACRTRPSGRCSPLSDGTGRSTSSSCR